MRFDGRTFVVTGGANGIGRGAARRLVDDGAHVWIVDADRRAGSETASELGERARFDHADISDERSVKRTLVAAARWQRGLHGVVHSAGLADPYMGPIEKLALASWQRMIDVDLTGTFLVAKHATPHLRKTRGALVNLGSIRALMSEPNTEAYATSKGGVMALTHALAISLGPDIRVNCISPGWIHTKATKLSKRDHAQHPVGRVGKPEDIASLAAWLLSDEAGFVTGQSFYIDGGITRKMIYA